MTGREWFEYEDEFHRVEDIRNISKIEFKFYSRWLRVYCQYSFCIDVRGYGIICIRGDELRTKGKVESADLQREISRRKRFLEKRREAIINKVSDGSWMTF